MRIHKEITTTTVLSCWAFPLRLVLSVLSPLSARPKILLIQLMSSPRIQVQRGEVTHPHSEAQAVVQTQPGPTASSLSCVPLPPFSPCHGLDFSRGNSYEYFPYTVFSNRILHGALESHRNQASIWTGGVSLSDWTTLITPKISFMLYINVVHQDSWNEGSYFSSFTFDPFSK